MYQLFVAKDELQIDAPTVQELLEKSLLESKISFKTLPEVLILLMPRFGVRQKLFKRIIPSPILHVQNFFENGRAYKIKFRLISQF